MAGRIFGLCTRSHASFHASSHSSDPSQPCTPRPHDPVCSHTNEQAPHEGHSGPSLSCRQVISAVDHRKDSTHSHVHQFTHSYPSSASVSSTTGPSSGVSKRFVLTRVYDRASHCNGQNHSASNSEISLWHCCTGSVRYTQPPAIQIVHD